MKRASWKRQAAVVALFAAPLVTAGAPASAQPKGAKSPATKAAKPPPAVKAPPVAKPPPPAATPPAAAPGGDTAKATQLFMKGSELFKAKKFIPALEHFKQSYATVPSPNSHLYIARCLAAIGETRLAWLEFDAVAEEAAARAASEPKYVPTRDSANVERDELAPKLGLVTVDVLRPDPAATVRIGAWPVPRDRWGRAYPVDPGTYDARLESPGRPPVQGTFTIGPGQRRGLSLDGGGAIAEGPKAPAPSGSKMTPLRIGGIVAASVGVVGFAMFAGGGIASTGTYSDLKTKCGGDSGGCGGLDVSGDISKGQTQQAIANAGLIIGAVGIAAGATMIGLSFRGGAQKDAGKPTAELVLGPSWAGISGSF